jgi:tetratricopeptide (TPR) repeat protein
LALLCAFSLCSSLGAQSTKAKPRAQAPLAPEELAAQAAKAVFVVECIVAGKPEALGSGFAVDKAGLLATNAHVVAGCDGISVRTSGDAPARKAMAVSIDPDRDVALILVPGMTTTALPLGRSQDLRPGKRVLAIGHPQGLEYTVSDGIVSAVRDDGTVRYIQTTAPISHGSSGGPLLDMNGQVVGMTTLYLGGGQNLNFAVPAEYIAEASEGVSKWLKANPSGDAPGAALLPPVTTPQTAAMLGRSVRKTGNYEAARSILVSALDRFPDDPALLLQLAELSWDEKAFDQAMQLIRKLLEVDPDSAGGHQSLSALLYREGKFDEARAEAQRCLDLNPDREYRSQAHMVLADCAAKEKAFADAANHVAKALEYGETRDNPAVHTRYAYFLLQAGRHDQADDEARLAISMDPSNQALREALSAWGLPRGARIVSKSDEWDPQNRYFVKGVVTNEGRTRLESVRVIAELRTDQNKLVGTGQAYVEPSLLRPGESGAFQVEVKGFSLPTPTPEPYPDLVGILGRRPVVTQEVVGRPGTILGTITGSTRQKQIDAQRQWDFRAAELIAQWEARRAAPVSTTGYHYVAYVATD